jgi:single-strand DNA-binding protein
MTGNLTKDPELRFTPAGLPVATFTVACNSKKKDPAGNWIDGDSTFLTVTVWRNTAENVAESIRKGTQVTVVGRLKQRSYEATDGTRRTVYEVDADSVSVSLAFNTVSVTNVERVVTSPLLNDDPWASTPAMKEESDPAEVPF